MTPPWRAADRPPPLRPGDVHVWRIPLAGDADALVEGFFATWSRKEAYLKATGHGITRGLHHFDAPYVPGVPPRLLCDRLEPDAPECWAMLSLDVAPRYSATLTVAAPL